jgi:hypothetical protein
VAFRGDAAFAKPELNNAPEGKCQVLHFPSGPNLERIVIEPLKELERWYQP